MTKEVEYDYITGSPNTVIESLNRSLGQFKRGNSQVKVGITGRNPQVRFNEHLKEKNWSRMVIIYKTASINFANIIEEWLVEKHYDELVNKKAGGGSDLSAIGDNYVYVLLK